MTHETRANAARARAYRSKPVTASLGGGLFIRKQPMFCSKSAKSFHLALGVSNGNLDLCVRVDCLRPAPHKASQSGSCRLRRCFPPRIDRINIRCRSRGTLID